MAAFQPPIPLPVSPGRGVPGGYRPRSAARSGEPIMSGNPITMENLMSAIAAYPEAADQAIVLLGEPEVADAWEEPSALAEMTVGALAGHLAYQIFSVSSALEEPASEVAPIPLLEHYARAAWLGAPLDSKANVGIRTRALTVASGGPESLSERASAAVAQQRTNLAERTADLPVFLPQTGWALTLDDFLTTRLLELAVHMDDLCFSVELDTPQLPDAAFDPVLILLARLAARRHGQAALLRALARAERAPTAINAI
jgi:hypothetical protein